AGQRLSPALRQKGPAEDQPGAAPPLRLFSHAPWVCRKIAANCRVSVVVILLLPACARRLRSRSEDGAHARLEPGRVGWRVRSRRDRHNLCAGAGYRHRGGGGHQLPKRPLCRYAGRTLAGRAVRGRRACGHRSSGHARIGSRRRRPIRSGARPRAGAAWNPHQPHDGERSMTLELNPRWFVAHTPPHSEPKQTSHLNRQGFETYFPRYLKRRRHARRVETVAAPLFPRYLFVAVDTSAQRWRSIYSTVGVARLVCNGDDPSVVPDGIVEALRSREDDSGFIKLDYRPPFRAGDAIRVLDGAFASC